MKKFLLSAIAILAFVTVANADPRFGVIAFDKGGFGGAGTAGLFLTDDVWNGSVTFGSIDNPVAVDTTDWTVAANYKMATDSTTAVTLGLAYRATTGTGISNANQFDVNLGIEKWLASNVGLTIETALYSVVQASGGAETKLVFGQTKVGVAYLFM